MSVPLHREGRITFQEVQTLFHEFGHALHHVLVRKRMPSASGLDYLPADRLEHVSMWFEQWAHHPDLARHVCRTPQEADALRRCSILARLEHRAGLTETAALAALDFEIHRRRGTGLAVAFDRLDQRYGIGAHTDLGDFVAYFTWPIFIAKPGAYFANLTGAAAACAHVTRYQGIGLDDMPPDISLKLFAPSLDFLESSTLPDSAPLFRLYADTTLHALAAV